jgi:hypothetical protein
MARRLLLKEGGLDGVSQAPNGFKYIGFSGATFSIKNETGEIDDVSGGTGIAGSTDVTYAELNSLISSNGLTPGSYYKITNFRTCYDQPDFDYYGNTILSDNWRTSDISPIIVLAISENKLAKDAYQPEYPKDKIKYDISFSTTEATGGTAYGRITERVDEFNNRTDYDHRVVKFKRYKSRLLDGTVGGYVLSMIDGLVIGTNSNFLGEFTTYSVVFIESENPAFYKVISVNSNTEMQVEGQQYNNFTTMTGYKIQHTYTESTTEPGCLYYFNDEGSSHISDGGDDMYDGANELNTDLYNRIPYTHTQMSGVGGQASIGDFTYDGTVQLGDSYFGASSSYFTNLYPGLFVMSAYGVSINEFSITGNLGSDGDGSVEVDRFEYEGYTIFSKIVYNAGDPSVNHLIIVNTIDSDITHDWDPYTEDDDDILSNLSGVTEIHYLLFGLASGVKPTTSQIQNVYQSYLNLRDLDINTTLSNLTSNFTDVTDNLPPNAQSYTSLEYRKPNVIEDQSVYREILTFDFGLEVKNTYLGDSCNSFISDGRTFMLPNSVFTNAYDNSVDVYDNYFGDRFINNTFGDDVYENNVGSSCYGNLCYDRFDGNQIKSNFSNNIFYTLEFENNTIGEYFENNYMMQGNDFRNCQIGNNFNYNKFFSDCQFYNNIVFNNFSNNNIYRNFYNNEVSQFSNNTIYDNFTENKCGYNFQANMIGTFNNVGDFTRNDIGTNFYSNLIQRNFSYNRIGSYFNTNNIGKDFGFELNGNIIGNQFYFNVIGDYFNNNKVSNLFTSNKIGNYFRSNDIQSHQLSFDFTLNYGNIVTFSENSGLSPSIPGLEGTYTGLTCSNSDPETIGTGASFDVVVSALGVVTSVSLNFMGQLYQPGDQLVILGSNFGGTDGFDIIINVDSISDYPVVYLNMNSTIVKNSDGNHMLYFLQESPSPGFVFTGIGESAP